MLKLKNFNLSLGIHVFVLISKIVGKTFTIKIVLDGFLYKKKCKTISKSKMNICMTN